jgi:hypothetical protein
MFPLFKQRFNLDLFCDLHILLGLFYLLPLLEVMNTWIKFAHERDVFICDFVTIVKFGRFLHDVVRSIK